MSKYVHYIIMLAAFGMLSAGWWVGKVDTSTYVTLAIACVGGALWQHNKTASVPNITLPKTNTNVTEQKNISS